MERVIEAVRWAMAALESDGVIDIEVAEDGLEVDIIGDEWTVHLEGWPERPVAFVALEDEPEEAKALAAARRRAMPADTVAALAAIDRRLDGELGEALRGTVDPLSVELAAVLGRETAVAARAGDGVGSDDLRAGPDGPPSADQDRSVGDMTRD